MSRASERFELSSSCCGVGSSNLSTSVTRDFKSVVSDGFKSRPVAGMKTRCSPQGFVTPRGHHPQEPVETACYPRINGYAFGELSTHKRLRFPRNPRINGYAFTHKRLRLFGSSPQNTWPGPSSPVFTNISNNPVLITRPLSGYAYKVNNS